MNTVMRWDMKDLTGDSDRNRVVCYRLMRCTWGTELPVWSIILRASANVGRVATRREQHTLIR
jgi:hypothetical protein